MISFETGIKAPMGEIEPALPSELTSDLYQRLFAGEMSFSTPIDVANLSVAGLCRATTQWGNRRNPKLIDRLDLVPADIANILEDFDIAQSEVGISFFRDAADREVVTAIVADIFKKWELVRYRRQKNSLLNDDPNGRWLAIETADAVMKVANEVPCLDPSYSEDNQRTISLLIANWGPGFAINWFNKTILEQWLDKEKIKDPKKAELVELFTPYMLKKVVSRNIYDPISGLKKVKNNLDNLTDEAIAQKLHISIRRAKRLFPPGDRKRIAVDFPNSVDAALRQTKRTGRAV